MFQLNKRNTIILVIIWVLCLGFIVANWYYNKSNSKLENRSYEEKLEYDEKEDIIKPDYIGLDYYSFYDENNLKIEEESDDKVRYLKISGLKNKDVQKKINDEIRSNVIKFNSDYNCSSFVYPSLNAFNVLSVIIRCYNNEDSKVYYRGLNYNLNDGNDIELKDVFSSNANLSNIYYSGGS